MQKLGKIIALMLAVSMVCALLSGCVEKQTQKEDKEIKLRIVTMFSGTDPATETYLKALDDFMAENPNVVITDESMQALGDEFRTKIKTDFASGNEPDVTFFFTAADAKPIIESGKVVAYEEIWKDYPDVGKDITEGVKDSMKEFDGKIYALPITGFYEGLFINKELFENNGLELPADWTSFENAIKVLSEKGIVPFAGPLGQSHYMIEHFILSSGGAAGHMDVFASGVLPAWVEGLDNIKKIYDMNGFAKDAISMDIEGAQNLFKQEKAAMILEGSWFIGGLSDEMKEKITVVPMVPTAGGKMEPTSIVAGFSAGYYISTKAYEDKKDTVVELVDFLTSADMIEKMAAANGGVPAASVSVPGLSSVAKAGHEMVANAKTINMPIDSRLTPEAFNYIVKEGTPFIAAGKKTAEEVLEEVMKLHKGE